MQPTAPPCIIRRPAADGRPARFEATWAPDAPATPRQRLVAVRNKHHGHLLVLRQKLQLSSARPVQR